MNHLYVIVIPNSVRKWQNEIGQVDENMWTKIFILPFRLTQSTDIRWFQLRIIHRILGTNKFLHKIGILDNDKCTFCKNESETILHVLCTCNIVRTFWNELFQWMKDGCTHIYNLNILDNEILFGITDNKKADYVLNFILLLAKQYIYKCKMKKQIPLLQGFKHMLKSVYNTEKFIAFKNCKWENFDKRWRLYKNLIINSQ